MAVMTAHAPGTFCWADLATTDAAGAKHFYAKLFGWTFNDIPLPYGGVYTMLLQNGETVAALSQMDPEQTHQAPPHWNSYVAVESVNACAARVAELDGSVLAPPFEVMDAGSMAVFQDPTGAILSVWQAKGHIGATRKDEPGSLCWNELTTRDTGTAREFYAAMFGWTPQAFGGGEIAYTEFLLSGRPVAGMMEISPDWGPMPPAWTPYFAVNDAQASVDTAEEYDGRILMPPNTISGVGCIAWLADPQGAVFAIIQPEQARP